MKRFLPLLALGAALSLHAAAPTAKVVQFTATDRVAVDVPFDIQPQSMNNEGISFTLLIEGESLVSVKKDSCVVESFTASGVKVPAGLAKRAKYNDFFSKVSSDGTYANFTVSLPIDNATQAKGMKLKGHIIFMTGDAEIKHPELTLPKKGEPAKKVGELSISRTDSTGGFFSASKTPKLAINITGPLNEIKKITFKTGGKDITSNSSMTSNDSKTYSFDQAPDAPVTVTLETYSGLKEVKVPFSFAN